jgi:hypothetical protein
MPFDIQIRDNIIRLTYTGYVTKAELFASAQEIVRVEGTFERRPDQLTDLSGIVDRETNYETLSTVASERRTRVFPNNWRLAMVAPTPLGFGLARMFKTLTESPQIDIQIFQTLAEAEAWLGT